MTSRKGVACNFIDLTGNVFGKWTVVGFTGRDSCGQTLWSVKCVCGHERSVHAQNLKTGRSTSCGIGRCSRTYIHGHTTVKEGASNEYMAWANMKARCGNPNFEQFKDYGGRGITHCSEWDSAETFLLDMGPKPSNKHTLERRDVNGNYSPDNCYWATWDVQAMNKRVRRGRYSKW